MTSFRRLRYGCCKGAHDADGCWARGPTFQPSHIQKAVQQYNLKHGVKPLCPPSEKQPLRGATFGAPTQRTSYGPSTERQPPFTRPQFRTMSLKSSQDQVDDDNDVLYLKSPDITDDDHVK